MAAKNGEGLLNFGYCAKSKDDERGVRIIDDYAAVHVPADHDPFVRQTWEEVRHEQAEVVNLFTMI